MGPSVCSKTNTSCDADYGSRSFALREWLSTLNGRSEASYNPTFGIWLPILFDILQMLGGFGNLALILTLLFSRHVQRHSTWLSFCFAWVFSSISYLLILGKQEGPQPPYGLCLMQASLSYAAPVLTAYAMLSCVVQLWFVVSSATRQIKPPSTPWQTYMLVASPWVLCIAILITSAVHGAAHSDKVHRAGSGVYCVIDTHIPGLINTILCMLAILFTLSFEAAIVRQCWTHSRAFRGAAHRSRLPMGTLIRVGIFTVIGILAIGVSVIFVTNTFSPLPNVFIAIMPVAAFLIFGIHMDIINAWLCRAPQRLSFVGESTVSITRATTSSGSKV